MEGRDYKPVCTPGMFERFLDNAIYHDFLGELSVRIEAFRDMLESPDTELHKEGLTTDMVRGGIKTSRDMLHIFEDLLANAMSDQEDVE